MLAEIAAGLTSLNAAKDIAKGLDSLKTGVAVNDAKIDLQNLILEAQQALFAAQESQTASAKRISELEQEIVRLKDWSAEKQRYDLADTGQGSVAYKLKEGVEPPEPQHWICPQCYQDGKKSILKHESLPIGRADTLVCSRCGYDVVTHGVRHNQNPPKPRAGAWGRGKGPF
jgi:hypothetical protein